jgi:hypothetical protein
MGQSRILGIEELAQGQVQAFTVVNDMLAAIEEAANDVLTITTENDYTVPVLAATRYGLFIFTGMTGTRTITFPSTVIGSNPLKRLIAVRNASTTHPLIISGTGGTSITIPRGASRVIHVNGTVLTLIAEGGVITGVPHTTAFFTAGHPAHDEEVLRYSFTENCKWVAGLSNSRGSVQIPPSPPAFFYFYKNGTQIGRIQISTGGTFTFTMTADVDWVPGDILTVKFQALEVGVITFNSVADTNDEVTIDNGTNPSETFTFGGGISQVPPGGNPTDSATNLQTAIQASSIASTLLVQRNGGILTIINLLPAGGGSITKVDGDNDYVVTDFATDTVSEYYGVSFNGVRT